MMETTGAKDDGGYREYNDKRFRLLSKGYNFLDPLMRSIRSRVLELSGADQDTTVLDVCTGTGEQAIAFRRMTEHVIGIDLSEQMLKKAKKKRADIDFRVADATDLPFEDKSFDIVCISFALHEMPSDMRHQAIEEMKRGSKGKIIVVDYNIPESRIRWWMRFLFISIFEPKYFREFFYTGLRKMFIDHELEIIVEEIVFFGLIRILVLNQGRED